MPYRILLAVCFLLAFDGSAVVAAPDVQSISLTYNGPPELEDNAVHRFAVSPAALESSVPAQAKCLMTLLDAVSCVRLS